MLEGLIIDDYVCLRIHERAEQQVGPTEDELLMEAAGRAYRAVFLEEAYEKEQIKARQFTVWGTEVDGDSGSVGAPLGGRVALCRLALHLATHGLIARVLVDRLGALFVHPFMHRR